MKNNWSFVGLIIVIALVAFAAGYLGHNTLSTMCEDTTETAYVFLPVTRCDSNTYAVDVAFYVRIDAHLSIREQCQYLANQLSRQCFGELPIEVLSIEERDDKRVAVIILREGEGNTRSSWRGGYFEGSCGGTVTSATLIGTFLQRDYDGEWVDGVRFVYEGDDLAKFDHVPSLCSVHWRDSLHQSQ